MQTANLRIQKLKPGVSKTALVFIAGGMWLAIGVMLNHWAYVWLKAEAPASAAAAALAGAVAGILIHRFGFVRIAERNLGRILPMEGKRCVFSFIPWKSYFLITIMILLGIGLRHSDLPRRYLAVLYAGIGTALILSSLRYLRCVHRMLRYKAS